MRGWASFIHQPVLRKSSAQLLDNRQRQATTVPVLRLLTVVVGRA